MTESQSRLSLGNSSALSQLVLQYGRPLSLDFTELGRKGGYFMLPGSQGPYVSLTSLVRVHDDSMVDQIFSSSDGQDWLFNSLSYLWIGFQFFTNMALFSSCKLKAATVAASKHEGRSAVLSRCSELPAAGFRLFC